MLKPLLGLTVARARPKQDPGTAVTNDTSEARDTADAHCTFTNSLAAQCSSNYRERARMQTTDTSPRACAGCQERRALRLPLPLACEACWDLGSAPGLCDLCGENDGHTNIWRHESCQRALETRHAQVFACVECDRWFDLANEDDASEWFCGHDCEAR